MIGRSNDISGREGIARRFRRVRFRRGCRVGYLCNDPTRPIVVYRPSTRALEAASVPKGMPLPGTAGFRELPLIFRSTRRETPEGGETRTPDAARSRRTRRARRPYRILVVMCSAPRLIRYTAYGLSTRLTTIGLCGVPAGRMTALGLSKTCFSRSSPISISTSAPR